MAMSFMKKIRLFRRRSQGSHIASGLRKLSRSTFQLRCFHAALVIYGVRAAFIKVESMAPCQFDAEPVHRQHAL